MTHPPAEEAAIRERDDAVMLYVEDGEQEWISRGDRAVDQTQLILDRRTLLGIIDKMRAEEAGRGNRDAVREMYGNAANNHSYDHSRIGDK